jgi:hypothetical protein
MPVPCARVGLALSSSRQTTIGRLLCFGAGWICQSDRAIANHPTSSSICPTKFVPSRDRLCNTCTYRHRLKVVDGLEASCAYA